MNNKFVNKKLQNFKVMVWLKKVKEKNYQQVKKNPELFYKKIQEKGDKFEKWLQAADKLSRHDWKQNN